MKYLEPDASTPADWNTPSYNADSWGEGTAGFGYGDEDDNTITNSSIPSVYIRREFEITDTSVIEIAILHVDYDDSFVAYLNDVEIARSNIGDNPAWNTLANGNHEALMYQGNDPEKFVLDMSLVRDIWNQGNNLLAIEVHNVNLTSSDLTLIPFLSFGIRTAETYFQPVPEWFPANTGQFMHTNFKIDPDGETLYLSSPGGAILDSLFVPRTPMNASVGRITDGALATGIFPDAIPGASNNTSQAFTNGSEPVPLFSVEAGFYYSPFSVSLSSDSPTSVIRYTTDGSDPTASSNIYSGNPVTISSTTTIKAKCFSSSDKLPSPPGAATYFINESHVLPVISISTDNENLYGPTGIFDNIDEEWNKPCYIEYFDEYKKLIFKQEAGIQIDGGWGGSRHHPQHSVRIEPGHGTLGDGDVKYPLIPDRRNRESYSSFYLRNGSNQYNVLQYKDGLQVKAIAKNTHTYYSGYSAIVAYINGSYFGLYELREKLNDDFLEENYLMDNDSLDMLTLSAFRGSILQAIDGSVEPFWEDWDYFLSLSPHDAGYLDQVGELLDLDNYTDYIIAESWIGNTDWFELYNGADYPVDIGGWYFTDSEPEHVYQFPAMASIDANSRLVVAHNTGDFGAKYPEVSNYTGPFYFKLGTHVDAIMLYDNTDKLIASVNYSHIFPWPLNGDETGRTLELRNPAGDLNDPSNWFAGCIGGSPGSPFSSCHVIGIPELPIQTLNSLSAYPNPASDYVNIGVSLQRGYKNCTLKVYDMLGTEVYSINTGHLAEGAYVISLDLSGIPTGLLIVVFHTEEIMEYVKILHVK